jgi:hypothetical protein
MQAFLHPPPDPTFLAYARAVIEFGGAQATEASAVQVARYLARGRHEY